VPDLRSKEVSAETGKRHRFRRKGVPSRLKIRFLDEAGEPRTDAWRLEIDGAVLEGKLGDGWIDQPLSPRARSGRLVLIGPPLEGEDQPHEDVHELALGYLDPIDTPSGVQGWLANLGLYDGPIDGNESEELEDAVARFQALHELDPTGVIDEATRSALADAGRG
jgi:N-acetylmuramoyl-L-alanine amidase